MIRILVHCIRLTVTAVTTLIMFILSGCSSKGDLSPFDLIPDNAENIAVIDLNALANAAGESSALKGEPLKDAYLEEDDLADASPSVLPMFLPRNLDATILAVASCAGKNIDLSRLTIISTPELQATIFPTDNAEALTKIIANRYLTASAIPDMKHFTDEGISIAIGRGLCIISEDATGIETLLAKVHSTPFISRFEGINQFLEGENAVKTARPAAAVFGDKVAGLWLCSAMRFTPAAIVADITMMSPDGKPDSIGARIAGNIDPDVIRFIPSGCTAVIASGKQSDELKLFGLEELANQNLPIELPTSPEGTTAIYLRPAGRITAERIMDPSAYNIAAVAQMHPDSALVKINRTIANKPLLPTSDKASGLYTIKFGNSTLSLRYLDGYLTESLNSEVTANNTNSLESEFNGAVLAAVVDIPTNSPLRQSLSLPFGASLSLKVTTFHIHGRLNIYDSKEPALRAVMSLPMMEDALPMFLGLN